MRLLKTVSRVMEFDYVLDANLKRAARTYCELSRRVDRVTLVVAFAGKQNVLGDVFDITIEITSRVGDGPFKHVLQIAESVVCLIA